MPKNELVENGQNGFTYDHEALNKFTPRHSLHPQQYEHYRVQQLGCEPRLDTDTCLDVAVTGAASENYNYFLKYEYVLFTFASKKMDDLMYKLYDLMYLCMI